MITSSRLPSEVWSEIFEQASDDALHSRERWAARNHTLFTLALVCHSWARWSERLLYGDLRIEWRVEAATRLAQTLDSSPRRRLLVQTARAYFTQKLDLLHLTLAEVRANPTRYESLWFDKLVASDPVQLAALNASPWRRRRFVEEKTYAAADGLLWRSPDSIWVQKADGPAKGTAAFLNLVASLSNLRHLHLDQFLDLPPSHFFTESPPLYLKNLLSLHCIDTSERLFNDLVPHLRGLEELSFDFGNDELQLEQEYMDHHRTMSSKRDRVTSDNLDSPPSSQTPHLHNLRTLRTLDGRFTETLSSILSTSPIEHLRLGPSETLDFISNHPSTSIPSVRTLHLDVDHPCAHLVALSPSIGTTFPSLEHLSLTGWEKMRLEITSLPASIESFELRLRAGLKQRIEDVAELVREVGRMKRTSIALVRFTVLDEGASLRGSLCEWNRWARVVEEALLVGIKVELQA